MALVSKIAITSTRDNPTTNPQLLQLRSEIYLINPDGSDPERLTNNDYGDGFAVRSPDGKEIVFDSNRLTADSGTLNMSDLFLMDTDGKANTADARKLRKLVARQQEHRFPRLSFVLRIWGNGHRDYHQDGPRLGHHARSRSRPGRSDQNSASDQHHQHP